MRDYQSDKNNQWHLPKYLYRQTLALIRDYSRLKEEYVDTIEETHAPEGEGRTNLPGDPTGALACRLDSMHVRISAVEKAMDEIPKEYMQGVWGNIVYAKRYPDDAGARTYGRWKARFIWLVAYHMKWI